MTSLTANSQSSKSDFWQLDDSRALLQAPRLRGAIDLLYPCRGLTAVCVDGSAQVGSLLAVDVVPTDGCGALRDQPWQIADAYIRGRDLVVAYREPLEQQFNLQLYWRAAESLGGAPALDLICSVQTPLWEAHPGVTVSSSMFDKPAIVLDGAVVSAGERELSYVEATRRGDFNTADAKKSQEFSGAFWQFGPHFMEKGVIRRLQLRGAFVPTADVAASGAGLAEELAAEEPALTA